MTEKNYFKLIEPYLNGELSSKEMKELEHALQQDPLLKGEFELQSQIVSGIRNYGSQQLKARLAAIEVPPVSAPAAISLPKWAMPVAAGIILSLGTAWFFQQNDDGLLSATAIAINIPQDNSIHSFVPDAPQLEEKEVEAKKTDVPTVTPVYKEKAKQVAEKVANPATDPKTNADENTVAEVQPQHLLNFDDEDLPKFNETAPVKSKPFDVKIADKKNVDIHLEGTSEHSFHYKYFNNKLFLYGDFKNIPYEILEINKKEGHQLFLYYQDSVYAIKDNTMDISPLLPIHNQDLASQLKIIIRQK